MERVELHCHSYFGAQDGTVYPIELVEYASGCEMSAMALTDKDTVLGYPSFRWATEQHGIKPIYGIELDGKAILVKDQLGKQVLYELLSQTGKKEEYGLYDEILNHHERFLIGSGNIEGDISKIILENEKEQVIDCLVKQYDFIEIQPHTSYLSLIDSNEYEYITSEQDLINLNRRLIELGEKYNIPVVATSNSYYINDDDKLCRDVVRFHAGYEKDDNKNYFRTTQEMLAEFPYLSEEKAYEVVVTNTNRIADMCEHIILMPQKKHYPHSDSDAQELDELCDAELKKKFGKNIPKEIRARVQWELDALHNTNMEFEIMYLYRMLKELNLKIHQIGFRGLCGNVYICYLLGITDVDPFEYHLSPYFALGYHKNRELDVDLNLSRNNRGKAIDFYMGEESLDTISGWLMSMYRENTDEIIQEYQTRRGIRLSESHIHSINNRVSSLYVNSAKDGQGVIMIPKGTDIYEFTPVVIDKDKQKIALFEYHSLDLSFYKQDLLSHYGLDILEELEEILGVVPENFTYDEPEIMNMFVVDDIMTAACGDILDFRSEMIRTVMKVAKPKKFDDLVKILGISHGTGTWYDNAEIILKDYKVGINELIGSRDDVFDYLCKYGIEEETAFDITELVRKGLRKRGKTNRYMEYVERMKEAHVPDWFVWSCGQIRYLFPRAHAIIYAKMNWRLAWYKLHYPSFFGKINEKHYEKFKEEQKRFFC